jgi:hypothetical protein
MTDLDRKSEWDELDKMARNVGYADIWDFLVHGDHDNFVGLTSGEY